MNFPPQDNQISSLIIKIASRCNLNCDYCYVYKHADQSYKRQPRLFSQEHIDRLAQRIDEYLNSVELNRMDVCLHGGEPLLAGLQHLEYFFTTINERVKKREKIRFVIQTNGVLLTKPFLDLFRKYQVGVSLSLDGPASANDKHRLDHRNRSTYDKVAQALSLLNTEYKDLFLGIISVIDPTNNPEELIDFFASINPPSYDMLFPDANHFVHPIGRDQNPTLYEEWIRRALKHWYITHPKLSLRMFRNIFEAISGGKTESEFFGNGNISYLIIESDGGYHCSDLLKATYEGASHTGLHLSSSTIQDVVNHTAVQSYQALLTNDNKCTTCLKCPELGICGSGQIAHRYGPNGFNHPSIYCQEMLTMIGQAKHLMSQGAAKRLIGAPELHKNELIQTFFSEHSLYLLRALLEKEPSLEIDEPVGFRSLKRLQEVFPAFAFEFQLFPHITSQLEEVNDSISYAEKILKLFLNQKLHLFSSFYNENKTGGGVSQPVFESVYQLAHQYRLWQHLAAEEELEEAYPKALKLRQSLIEAITLLKNSTLTTNESTFLFTLIDAFLPGESDVPSTLSA